MVHSFFPVSGVPNFIGYQHYENIENSSTDSDSDDSDVLCSAIVNETSEEVVSDRTALLPSQTWKSNCIIV